MSNVISSGSSTLRNLNLNSTAGSDHGVSGVVPPSSAASVVLEAEASSANPLERAVAHIRNIPASVTSLFSRVAASISAWAGAFIGAIYDRLPNVSAAFSCFSRSNQADLESEEESAAALEGGQPSQARESEEESAAALEGGQPSQARESEEESAAALEGGQPSLASDSEEESAAALEGGQPSQARESEEESAAALEGGQSSLASDSEEVE